MNLPAPLRQRGTSLIEVMVSLLIVSVGLLGLAGLQSRLQAAEFDSYQRSQALVLLDDMASRITVNRANAASYSTTAANPLGAGMVCPVPANGATRQQLDVASWCHSLQGAAEISGGARAGAMIGGRGCVEALPDNEYLVSVTWQGFQPITAPASGADCGQNLYDGAAAGCSNDRCRRIVTTVVRIGTLN